jgi:hypothetical protein
MTKASPRPPLLAVWMVELFVPEEQASSVLGDLVEEFSDVAARSSVANAQRWYWRRRCERLFIFWEADSGLHRGLWLES